MTREEEPEDRGQERPALPKRAPAPVRRGPRPRPGRPGPEPAEPGPIAAVRRMRHRKVPLERVRRALEELNVEGEPPPRGDGTGGD